MESFRSFGRIEFEELLESGKDNEVSLEQRQLSERASCVERVGRRLGEGFFVLALLSFLASLLATFLLLPLGGLAFSFLATHFSSNQEARVCLPRALIRREAG